ncbi:MAG: glycoside hydrolase family 97 C-terminal domain-containing protein [Clostridia bacterium]|nr:glycoside hydrolase family 97 C-terminal domain-containing protein [Clostridia bacterium]
MFVTQPFVRNLAGHADYTPACESAFYMAQLVLTDAPMQAIGSDPAVLLKSETLEMFKSVPTVWQETVVLPQSAIGQAAIYARKGADASWYVGGINFSAAETETTIRLADFLGDGTYRLELWTDGKNGMECTTKTVTNTDTVTVPFAKKSGFILRLDRVTLSQYGGEINVGSPITVTLADANTVVRYTLDGSQPTTASPIITTGQTLPVTDTCVLTLTIMSGPDSGATRRYRFNKLT